MLVWWLCLESETSLIVPVLFLTDGRFCSESPWCHFSEAEFFSSSVYVWAQTPGFLELKTRPNDKHPHFTCHFVFLTHTHRRAHTHTFSGSLSLSPGLCNPSLHTLVNRGSLKSRVTMFTFGNVRSESGSRVCFDMWGFFNSALKMGEKMRNPLNSRQNLNICFSGEQLIMCSLFTAAEVCYS